VGANNPHPVVVVPVVRIVVVAHGRAHAVVIVIVRAALPTVAARERLGLHLQQQLNGWAAVVANFIKFCVYSAGKVTGTYWRKLNLNSQNKLAM
jgi:hypothetical protein